MGMWVRLGLLLALGGLVLVAAWGANASPGITERVSVSTGGSQATGDSGFGGGPPAVSASGRYVAFDSVANNLVADDTNNAVDIFLRDRDADSDGIFDEPGAVATIRVSLTSGGDQANGFSFQPSISGDGRYVAFESYATNLVAGDTNNSCDTDGDTQSDDNCPDIFVRDRDTDGDGVFDEAGAVSTTRVSVASGGGQGNGLSLQPSISSGGRYVAFFSEATNLVAGDTNNSCDTDGDTQSDDNCPDVFVRDRDTDEDGVFDEAGAVSTTRVSVASGGGQGNGFSLQPSISGDGRYVTFESDATNLVAGDTNAANDIFMRDRQAGSTVRVSLGSGGAQGDGPSFQSAISSDGRHVAFFSEATNLVAGDTNNSCDTDGDTQSDDNCPDVFLRDIQSAVTERVSVNSAGGEGNGLSDYPALSGDGRYVAFFSEAANLVPGDTNGAADVFVRDRTLGNTMRVSVNSTGGQAEGGISTTPALSADGRFVAFYSRATNLVAGDTNGLQDVFVHGCPAAVGGIAELPDVSGPSGPNRVLLAGLAAALALLTAGAWYAGKRFRRGFSGL
jgi:Tol biopolymer transport system component